MKRLGTLGLLVFLACREEPPPSTAPPPTGPVKWEVRASADRQKVQIGEPVTVSVTVRHPAGAEFLLPTGASLAPFELLDRVDEPPSWPTESHIKLRLAAYRLPGEISIPSLRVEYRDDSGKLASVETRPIPVTLLTSLTPDITDIHDLKGPIADIPLPWRWGRLWWLVAALAAAVLGYFLYRKLRRKKAVSLVEAPLPPLLPPEEEAERSLRNLANARLLEQGKVVEFYTALAEIVKRYAGRRFEVPYLERTTTEILADLKKARVRREWIEQLGAILELSDLVKFARFIPGREESNRMLPEAFRFVEETRPEPVPVLPTASPAMEARA